MNKQMALCDELEKKVEKRDKLLGRIMQAVVKWGNGIYINLMSN